MNTLVNTASLFERLGGTAGIGAIVDSLIAAHLENPAIRARFVPYLDTPERIEAIKGHVCTFLEAGSGGPRAYTGRAMRDAHRGMNINEAEFVATLDDILLVLRKHGIDIVQRSKRIVGSDRPLGRLNTRSRTGVAANRRALDRQRNHEIRDLLWVLGAQPIVCGTTHARREVAITVAGCCVRPRHLEQPRRVHAA